MPTDDGFSRGPQREYLRVAIVCPYSLTLPGGVQMQVLGLARQLRAMGHEARVLGPCDGAPPATFVTPLGDSLPTAANGSMAPLAPDPSCALRTIRALRDEEFDVLHIHEPLVPGASVTALLLKTAPTIGTFHAAGESASYRYLNGPLRRMADGLDLRVAVSKDARALAEGHLGGTYEVLFNGVEIERYRSIAPWAPDPGSANRGSSETASAGSKAIFFCGRHEPRKGLDVLLAAHASLPSDVALWIASDGPDTARLQREYAGDSRISWLGRIDDEEKIARLRAAAVFCAPSLRGESFGVVLIEAMAAGTPVVASALDGYRNVASDGVDALLVPPGDTVALRDALARVLAGGDLAASLVAAGDRRAESFSMSTLAGLYVERYQKVIAAADVEVRPTRWRRAVSRMLGG